MKASVAHLIPRKQRRNSFFYRKRSKRMLEIAIVIAMLAFLSSLFSQVFSAEPSERENGFYGTFENFMISKSEGDVQISWINTETYKDECFIILRSTDKINFVPVGMKMSNTPEHGRVFTFKDQKPVTGKAYYKLCRASLEGSTRFSGIKSIEQELALGK